MKIKTVATFIFAMGLSLLALPFAMIIPVLGGLLFALLFGWTYPNWFIVSVAVFLYVCGVGMVYEQLKE